MAKLRIKYVQNREINANFIFTQTPEGLLITELKNFRNAVENSFKALSHDDLISDGGRSQRSWSEVTDDFAPGLT